MSLKTVLSRSRRWSLNPLLTTLQVLEGLVTHGGALLALLPRSVRGDRMAAPGYRSHAHHDPRCRLGGPVIMTSSPVPSCIPLFPLGQIVATPNALDTLRRQGVAPVTLLHRHVHGDWGELDPEDVQANQEALREGARVLSSYRLAEGVKVWIITEADRSVTTLLLPDDY